jgi:threonine aldolase
MPDPYGFADFRSDTVTRPTPEMRKAMFDAEVGDDVLGDDPTVKALEAEAVRISGKPRALFVPSGTMANQIAIHVHCRPGDEILTEERSHTFLFEAAGAARFSGTQIRPFPARGGIPDVATIKSVMRSPNDPHEPRSRLLVVENTHNMAGGRVIPLPALIELRKYCLEVGLKLHMDGARVFNASVRSGVPVDAYAACTDSIMFCLSKGLGAPVGSMLCGEEEFIREALRARKAFGGGMRQAGVIAAAGLLALKQGWNHLKDDHKRAMRLALAFEVMPGVFINPEKVETNIVMLKTPGHDAHALVGALRTRKILALAIGPRRIRFVLHRDVNDRDVFRLIGAMSDFTRLRPEELPRPGVTPAAPAPAVAASPAPAAAASAPQAMPVAGTNGNGSTPARATPPAVLTPAEPPARAVAEEAPPRRRRRSAAAETAADPSSVDPAVTAAEPEPEVDADPEAATVKGRKTAGRKAAAKKTTTATRKKATRKKA